jgi:carboxymethylenebutenolidase
MSRSHVGRRGAVSYLLVALASIAAGAAGAWVVQQQRADADHAHGAAARLEAVTTHGEWVAYARGSDSIRAYVAYPERKDRAPAVIVIHEVYGLTEWEPTVADRLAKSGYVAIVPDLLSSKFGRSPATADSGRKLIGQLEPDRITADLDATVRWLQAQPAVAKDRIGTIGFCWGGGQVFRYATDNPALKAAVVCYGPAPADTVAQTRIKAPVLGVYGENDARINAALPEVQARLDAAGVRFRHRIYEGTGHGFLKPGRRGSDGPQVEAAWADILGFYQANLDQ